MNASRSNRESPSRSRNLRVVLPLVAILSGMVAIAAGDTGGLDRWRIRPVLWTEHPGVHDVVFASGRFLAVGDGVQFQSNDGLRWSELGRDRTYSLRRVIEDIGGFLAVGGPAPVVIQISADGRSGDVHSLPGTGTLRGAARRAALRVLVGDGGMVFTATNQPPYALEWIARPSETIGTSDLTDIVHAAGLFVAVGERRRIWTSTDGVGWTLRFAGGQGSFRAVAASGSEIVAVAEEGEIWRSVDGRDWIPVGNAGVEPRRVGRAGDRWVVAGRPIALSTDLRTWMHPAAVSGYGIEGVAHDARPGDSGLGVLVEVGTEGAVLTSLDGGATWATQRLAAPSVDRDLANPSFGNGVFVTDAAWSPDGAVWNRRDRGVEQNSFQDGVFTGFGTDGGGRLELVVSTDGHRSVAFGGLPVRPTTRPVRGNGRYVYVGAVAVGIHRSIAVGASSVDGVDWLRWDFAGAGLTSIDSPYVALAFGNGRFVAAGGGNPTMISSDGVSWRQAGGDSRGYFQRLEFANGQFIASVSATGTAAALYASVDGESWVAISGSDVPSWHPIREIAGGFVTLSAGFELLSSSNRIDWVRRAVLPAGTGFLGAAFGGTSVVVIGAGGVILQAGLEPVPHPVEILGPRLLGDGARRVLVRSPEGESLRVEASVDLRTWELWRTLPDSDGVAVLEDFDATGAGRRFYRAVVPGPAWGGPR